MSRTPILLALGAVEPRPVARDGQVVIRPILVLSATFDHRLMDGYQAGRLAQAVKRYLADPAAYEPALPERT
jgi:pyruvate dehydrogenase E2 component (dihydrolipoamide acetyltransferase)